MKKIAYSLLFFITAIAAEPLSDNPLPVRTFKPGFMKSALIAKTKESTASLDDIEQYVKQGVPLNICDSQGNSLLHMAILNNNLKLAEYFIIHGVAIDHKNNAGKTALMLAAKKQYIDGAKLLIKHNADVNAIDLNKMTPLMYAALSGNALMVELILDYGADAHAVNGNGETPLMYGVRSESLAVVKTLIMYEIAKDSDPAGNMYHIALIDQSYAALIQTHDPKIINEKTTQGVTALMMAASWGFDEIADYLIRYGADVSAKTNKGTTALHVAARYGSARVVEMIWANGGNINAQTKEGVTPLMLAVQEGHEDIVKSLIYHDADITLEDNEGYNLYVYTNVPDFRNVLVHMVHEYRNQKKQKTEL